MELTEHLLDPARADKDRFQDARQLRDLLDKHARSAGGDPGDPAWRDRSPDLRRLAGDQQDKLDQLHEKIESLSVTVLALGYDGRDGRRLPAAASRRGPAP